MILRDRKVLAMLMAVQHVSQRQLATAAGWSAHSHLSRLLKGSTDGIEIAPAVRIADYLHVPVEALFAQSRDDIRSRPSRRRAA